MSNILNRARLRACHNFERMLYISNELRIQNHRNDCVTKCLSMIGTGSMAAPSDGLTWSETQVMAARFAVYLQPLFDGVLCHQDCVLLCLHTPSKTDTGHAFLVRIRDGKPERVYDPASGGVNAIYGELPDWTHAAIVYSL